MKHGLGMSIALALCGTAEAADPPASALAVTPARSGTLTEPVRRLDLSVGDIRKYMMPNEFRAAVNEPEADKDAVVVEGTRELLPLKSLQPIPAGFPPATLWWAARNPAKSWRILLPDLNAPASGPTYDKVPPPIFRWGP